VKITLLLCDSAQAVGGKLYILGGGWSLTGPEPTPMAIALKIDVPWDQTNRRHKLRLELVDSDGEPFIPPGEEAGLFVEADFEVGRPAGLKQGTSIDLPFAVNIGPLPLKADSRYVWRVSIDGHSESDWQAAFSTRPSVS
jgi:hypothetical protein